MVSNASVKNVSSAKYERGESVHVSGWNKGCVFIYLKTVDGVHHLKTPRTGKTYTTRNPLTKIRKRQTKER